MSGTSFYKMSGSGNDFVMLDGRQTTPADWPAERIRAVCDRRNGVGADGLLIETHHDPDAALCDGPQALLPAQLLELATRMHGIAAVVGREFAPHQGPANG